MVVQSGLLDRWERRIVVPLGVVDPQGVRPDALLNPELTIDGIRGVVAAQEIGNVPHHALGELVINLRGEAETIIGAIDWALNQGFG